jgi:hypothetical protein
MKYILLLLLSLSAVAQTNDNISVVSAEKLNVVYRGIENPIKIIVPGIASDKIRVSAPGIRKDEGEGNYMLTPGIENEIKIHISYKNSKNEIVVEEKTYTVKPFPSMERTINGEYHPDETYKLTRSQLEKLKIEYIYIPECSLFENAVVKRFDISVPGYETITCIGNVLNEKALSIVKKAKLKGEEIIVHNVVPILDKNYPAILRREAPIVIKLID